MPRLIPCNTTSHDSSDHSSLLTCSSSPPAGGRSRQNMSTMSLTRYSLCPTPTVSTSTMSYPPASHNTTASLVVLVTPPKWPRLGLGLMKARMSRLSSGIRVLSPRMLPPVEPLLSSSNQRLVSLCVNQSEISTYLPGINSKHSHAVSSVCELLAEDLCEGALPCTRGSG